MPTASSNWDFPMARRRMVKSSVPLNASNAPLEQAMPVPYKCLSAYSLINNAFNSVRIFFLLGLIVGIFCPIWNMNANQK